MWTALKTNSKCIKLPNTRFCLCSLLDPENYNHEQLNFIPPLALIVTNYTNTPWTSRRILWCQQLFRCSRGATELIHPLSWFPVQKNKHKSRHKAWFISQILHTFGSIHLPIINNSIKSCSIIITKVSLSTFGIGGSSMGI